MTREYNILFVARDDGGCGFFRCVQPATFLQRSGLAHATSVLRNPTHEQLLNSDLVILQDTGSQEAANIIKFMVEHKIPFMTEFDDFVHHISPRNTGGYIAWNPSTLFTYRAMEATRKAVGVTVSTPFLAKEYFPYNPLIYVIPNFLDRDKWDNPITRRQDGKIRIGWCGGNAHGDDLHMISKVIEKLVKEYDGKVVFETLGMTRQELAGVFPMAPGNQEPCPSCGHEGTLHHHPGESLNDYPTALCSKGWDIAVAPVIDNSFGNAKSDLKIKEYAAAGIPIVASPVAPYREAADSGARIVLCRTFDEWYNGLKTLIESQEIRDSMVRENREWVQQFWIQDNIPKLFEAYVQTIHRAEAVMGTRAQRTVL